MVDYSFLSFEGQGTILRCKCCACGMSPVFFFFYMALIGEELQKVVRLWNLHQIRPSTRNNNSPHGLTCLLYQHPEKTGAVDCKQGADNDELDVARGMCCDDLPIDSSPQFVALAELIMREGLRMPENANEARNLYLVLVT